MITQTLLLISSVILPVNAGALKCRVCHNAVDLGSCNTQAVCDDTIEMCYIDEIVTDKLSIVFNAGCRAKDVCTIGVGTGAHGVGKKRELIACSRCCSDRDDCNSRLCGIKNPVLNVTQCYSCNEMSNQRDVNNPTDCVTLTTCASNEVCYAQTTNFGTVASFQYGCERKTICSVLMRNVMQDFARCDSQSGDPSACGSIGKRNTILCNSCCADGGCNYGTCEEINLRLYKLYQAGKFDLQTLRVIP